MMARGGFVVAAVTLAALVLAGCSSTRTSSRTNQPPPALQPLPSSTVATGTLPPLGTDGSVTVAAQPGMVNPNLTGQPTTTGPTLTPAPPTTTIGADPSLTASNDGFVTLDSVGSVPATPGRDLTGGLTEAKLLGGWTVVSGPTQCRLNLTQTQKSGTSRYRASTPGCQLPGLAAVSSWQLAGSQVQLFDENNNMVAALILSGNRFIGTLAGGQGISMTS